MRLSIALDRARRPGDPLAPDILVGVTLALAYLTWLVVSARSLGFARDETFYFRAAMNYSRWLELLVKHHARAFDPDAIDGAWGDNHEHPALMKALFGISYALLHDKWEVFSDASTSFRFPGMVMGALSVGLTYAFGAVAYTRRAGAMAAVLVALMPHLFYNAHLACFDVPIMTMWLATVFAYYAAVKRPSWGRILLAGVVYGLTLETKHNAWILPAVVLPHAALVLVAGSRRLADKLRLAALVASLAVVGPLVFLALWPWLWHETTSRVREYVEFHVHHVYYNLEYLGKNYFRAPSPVSYAPVLVAATVPTITLLLFGIGVAARAPHAVASARAKGKNGPLDEHVDALFLLAFAAPLSVFFLPQTPIFGGTKHWLPSYPFLALIAGAGFEQVCRWVEGMGLAPRATKAAVAVVSACVVAAPLAITAHSHPFGLSTYVPLVGGTAGGATLGLNRQFWGYTTQSLAPYFEQKAPPSATVFIHDTTWDAFSRMQDEGRMRKGLRPVGNPTEAMFAIVQHELHMNEVDHQIWVAYKSPAPDYVLTHDGVPILSVYRRPW